MVKQSTDFISNNKRNWLIHLHFVRKEFEQCIKIIQHQLEESKFTNQYALFMQALIRRQQGRVQDALDSIQKLANLTAKSTDIMKELGRCLFLTGKFKTAFEIYQQVLENNPKCQKDAQLIFDKGLCLKHMGDNESAILAIEDSIRLSHSTSAYLALVEMLEKQGDQSAIKKALEEGFTYNKNSSELAISLGIAKLKAGDKKAAFEILAQNMKKSGEETDKGVAITTVLAAGSAMQRNGDVDVALMKYKQQLSTHQHCYPLLNNFAATLMLKNKPLAALTSLQRAHYLNPHNWQICANLGRVFLTRGQPVSAFHYMSSAIAQQPHNGKLFGLLATTLAKLEDPESAEQAFERAISLGAGEDPETRLNYAVFLFNEGRSHLAKEHLNSFKTLLKNSNDKKINEGLVRLANHLEARMTVSKAPVAKKKDEPDVNSSKTEPSPASNRGRLMESSPKEPETTKGEESAPAEDFF